MLLDVLNAAISILNYQLTFRFTENVTYTVSIWQVIIGCLIISLFFYIFNRVYE